MPTEDVNLVSLRHSEWIEHQVRWRWLQDSLEGGNRYRNAVYGYDRRGLPVRNLVRHKREYPDPSENTISTQGAFLPQGMSRFLVSTLGIENAPGMPGSHPNSIANDDDYEMRRARTPVPCFVEQAVDTHLSRIYAREIKRELPKSLEEWAKDVDGSGASLDQWMADVIAPLFCVLGFIDLCFDHPAVDPSEQIVTEADARRLGINRCVASYILPENVVNWRLKPNRRYAWCRVREYHSNDKGEPIEVQRLWTETDSTLFDVDGRTIGSPMPHDFGVVPIVRVFTRRKTRCKNVGWSSYEKIAEQMQEFYNRDSELILSDTLQAHPLLQGPEDYAQADGTVPVGPSWMLPKKKNQQGGTYEGFDYIDPPKGGAESIRQNKNDIRNEVDRAAGLTKPAGATGTTGGTVSQSGISKRLDNETGSDILAKLAASLERLEVTVAEFVLTVLGNGKVNPADMKAVSICYPRQFDLQTADELSVSTTDFQGNLSSRPEFFYSSAIELSAVGRETALDRSP